LILRRRRCGAVAAGVLRDHEPQLPTRTQAATRKPASSVCACTPPNIEKPATIVLVTAEHVQFLTCLKAIRNSPRCEGYQDHKLGCQTINVLLLTLRLTSSSSRLARLFPLDGLPLSLVCLTHRFAYASKVSWAFLKLLLQVGTSKLTLGAVRE
jgi:hypothetical protein